MIRRVVLVQFSGDATAEQIERFVETVKSFPKMIPEIKSLSRGLHMNDGDDSVAFSHVSQFDFETMEDLQRFLTHPVHLEAIKGIFADVVAKRAVVNYQV